jgi:hypothetical protein
MMQIPTLSFRILDPDPGSRGKKHKKHQIPDPDPQHCLKEQGVLLLVLWLLILIDKAG